MKYGPNTPAVERLIQQARTMTLEQAKQIRLTWDNDSVAARAAAQNASWDFAWNNDRVADREAARIDVRDAVWGAVWGPARDATFALVVRELISEKHFDTLYGPWASVFGPPKS